MQPTEIQASQLSIMLMKGIQIKVKSGSERGCEKPRRLD